MGSVFSSCWCGMIFGAFDVLLNQFASLRTAFDDDFESVFQSAHDVSRDGLDWRQSFNFGDVALDKLLWGEVHGVMVCDLSCARWSAAPLKDY